MDQMTFSDFSCFINKLKAKQTQFERNENDLLKLLKNNYDILLEDQREQLKVLREQELQKVQAQVHENITNLKQIKSAVSREKLKEIDVDKLKSDLVSLENNIKTFKSNIFSELDKLKKEEKSLTDDLTSIEVKLDALNKQPAESKELSINPSKKDSEHASLYQEVKDFQIFLNNTGGHNGRWSREDHLTFLKINQKHKNQNKIVLVLHGMLPDISENAILAHYEWYKQYLDLRQKQRGAIEKWKHNKDQKDNKEEKQKPEESSLEVPKKQKEIGNEVREKLEAWKLEKQQKIEKNLATHLQNIKKLKENETQKRLKQIETKKVVEKWKTVKSAEEKAKELEKEITSLKEQQKRVLLANRLIRDFQQQDNFYITQRLEQLRSKISSKSSSVSVNSKGRDVARDPSRIFRITKQWASRISSSESDGGPNVFGQIPLKGIPKLAVPDWRKTVLHK